jgi:putative hydrolase of HD superfamily
MPTDTSLPINIARLALALGRVDRITQHPDGYPESDTDHTVMLALVAAEMAPARLDRGRVLAYALVHDLVEAYAGDTPTLVALDDAGRAAKDAREAAALARIRAELGAESWVVRTIEAFEAQGDPEARWVKHMDKCVPKLTHALNGGRAVRAQGLGLEDVQRRVEGQLAHAARTSPDLPEAVELGRALLGVVVETWSESSGGLVMDLMCVEDVIENELAQGLGQKQIAMTYGLALRSSWPTDWHRVNAAIVAKWPKALDRIKRAAWEGKWNGVPFGGGSDAR